MGELFCENPSQRKEKKARDEELEERGEASASKQCILRSPPDDLTSIAFK